MRSTFYVDQGSLFDPNGSRMILRGINLPLLDDWGFPPSSKLANLAETGANAVRIEWYIKYPHKAGDPVRPAYSLTDLDNFLGECQKHGLVAILGLWDFTCGKDISRLNDILVPWWISHDVRDMLAGHQQYLIINPANELGIYAWADPADRAAKLTEFKNAYKTAIASLRTAFQVPLLIDAPDCSQTLDAWLQIGQELIDSDLDKNILLDVHAYWAAYDGMPQIDVAVAAKLPLVFGEVANKQDEEHDQFCFYNLDGQPGPHPAQNGFTYQHLLEVLTAKEMGWLAWSWYPDSCEPRRMATYDDDGNFLGLSAYGEDIVNSPVYGIKRTARRASIFSTPVIPDTANSIKTAPGGIHDDPGGVAPSANTQLLTWKDARGKDRTMMLGAYLCQYEFSFDHGGTEIRRTAGDKVWGHEGFGYVVSHVNDDSGNSPLGKIFKPDKAEPRCLLGGHHAFYRVELCYDRDAEGGGAGIKIPVVIEWFVATGRDHPVWAVTWKVDDATVPAGVDLNKYCMDSRGPYGSLAFDGAIDRDHGLEIAGVAWGDFGLKFKTEGSVFTPKSSAWSYDKPNRVCFSHEWTGEAPDHADAEMGIVQTRVGDREMGYLERVAKSERGHTSGDAYPLKGDCGQCSEDDRHYAVPCITCWPYQLINYDWDPTTDRPLTDTTGTKLVAWGTPYGWLGGDSFILVDPAGTAHGHGDRSYATFIVLGPHTRPGPGGADDGDVARTIRAVEALNDAVIGSVATGSLVTQVPKGPGAGETKTIANGYNDTYAAYYLQASGNKVTFTFTPAAGTAVENPIFVIQNYDRGQLPAITCNDQPLDVNTGPDAGAFVSLNQATGELWVTLHVAIDSATTVQITG